MLGFVKEVEGYQRPLSDIHNTWSGGQRLMCSILMSDAQLQMACNACQKPSLCRLIHKHQGGEGRGGEYLVAEADDRHHEGVQESVAHRGAQEGVHDGLQQGCHQAAAAAGQPAPQVQLQHQGHQALVGGAAPLQVLRLQG